VSRFVFVHAADLHLDTPFSGLAAVSPRVAEALRDASLAAWDALVELAFERQATFVVLAGDIYDGPERGVRAQLRFLRGLERLASAGKDTFVVHGNHDPVQSSWSAIQRWPERVHVFGSEACQTVGVEVGGARIATVHGISYATRETRENLALRFRRGPEDGIHIGLLHANVGGQPEHDPYSPCTVEDLSAIGMDYWALGHVHTRQFMCRSPWVVYPGNLQGRSPRQSELGPKGAVVVTVENGHILEPEFCPLDRVRFVGAAVDIAGLDDLGAVDHALESLAEHLRDANKGRGLVVRVQLTGRGLAHGLLAEPGANTGLLKALRDRYERVDPFLWWERIDDGTGALLDPAAIRARHDFSSELLARSDRLGVAPEELARILQEAPLPPLAKRLAGQVSPQQARSLLEEALELALSRLEEEAS
jgi:DNA repair exonuclease SbcCD nuclease subunit